MIGLFVLMIRLMFELFEWSVKLSILMFRAMIPMFRAMIVFTVWLFKVSVLGCVAAVAMIQSMRQKSAP
jgi:hypothetical protein